MENNNTGQKSRPRNFRLIDMCVILLCISSMLFFLYLLRNNLNQSVASPNKILIGKATDYKNTVKRRLSDSVLLWSRLSVNSDVYSGDTIYVAKDSEATLHIKDKIIKIGANYIIRIDYNEGRVVIDLDPYKSELITLPPEAKEAEIGNGYIKIDGKSIKIVDINSTDPSDWRWPALPQEAVTELASRNATPPQSGTTQRSVTPRQPAPTQRSATPRQPASTQRPPEPAPTPPELLSEAKNLQPDDDDDILPGKPETYEEKFPHDF